MAYGGESVAKKVARAFMYDCARSLLGKRVGTATVVGLCGPEGRDLDPIRAFGITRDPSSVMLCDIESVGLRAAEERWPGVRTFHGWMHEAPLPWSVDLAVFDFCGTVESDAAMDAFRAIGSRLRRPGAVVAVTYLRGREPKSSKVMQDADRIRRREMRRHGRVRCEASLIGNLSRAGRIYDRLNLALGLPPVNQRGLRQQDLCLWFADLSHYNSRSPMGVAIFQVARRINAHWDGEASWSPGSCDIPEPAIFDADKGKLLATADHYDERGMDSALALSVSRGTLAAWRAHRTMGTYGVEAA